MDIASIFITGLFAGGLTCLAVQGGLLASSIAQQKTDTLTDETTRTGHALPILSFLVTRLVAYTILGAILGSLGSVAQLSLNMRITMQVLVAFFMIGTALNLLNVHPLFRYFVIQPPRFLTRLVKTQSKSSSIFGPALLGALTVLIPCGATQAMMAYAVTTASPVAGAVTLFVFILGTSPLFYLLGYAAKKFGTAANGIFNKIAAVAILLIAIYNLNGAIALTGSPYTLENYYAVLVCSAGACPEQKTLGTSTTTDQATITFTASKYVVTPSSASIKAGSKVKLTLKNDSGTGCIQAFTIPKLGIQKIIRVGTEETIEFTAPNEPGQLAFMCSMGMYRGSIPIL